MTTAGPAVAKAADAALVRGMHAYARSDRRLAEELSHQQRLDVLAQIRDQYAPIASGDHFFSSAAIGDPHVVKMRSIAASAKRALGMGKPSAHPPPSALDLRHSGVYDVSWPSTYRVWLAPVRAAYESRIENRTAHARLYVGGGARPMAIIVHGYMGGVYAFEERAWPIEWLMRLGLDVAIFTLPNHGKRARTGPPVFPSSDPRLTNEGFGQAIVDLKSLVSWLRERGTPSVGLLGMSLGGYAAALAATLDPDLSFLVPIVPLASIADFAHDHGRLGDGPDDARLQHAALEEANRVVSPLARPPRIAPERVLVIAGESDRVTPRAQAVRLAAHFSSDLVTMPGGHLLQFGRETAFAQIAERLHALGITKPIRGAHP